jgi:hypothetical protein
MVLATPPYSPNAKTRRFGIRNHPKHTTHELQHTRCQIQGLFWGPWVLLPAGYLFWDPKIFPLGRQNRRHLRSSRHVLIERKAKSNAGGLHLLLIIKRPGATPAILLLQLLLN